MASAKHVHDWGLNFPLSYHEYLQAQEFEQSIKFSIKEQTRELIGTREELMAAGFVALKESAVANTAVLAMGLSEVADAVRESTEVLNSTLVWGFSETLLALGKVNDSLASLVAIAKSPSQTWAMEQFDAARDEHRRDLPAEALASVDRAIGGFGSNPGFKTQFRFHLLRGAILLGGKGNTDPAIVDPAKAEEAFLQAARYARTDHPAEAGKALFAAGRAAFVQRELDRAILHTEGAISLMSAGVARLHGSRDVRWSEFYDHRVYLDHAPVLYQLARLLLGRDAERSFQALTTAFVLEPYLAGHAAVEEEFRTKAGTEFLQRSLLVANNALREEAASWRKQVAAIAQRFSGEATKALQGAGANIQTLDKPVVPPPVREDAGLLGLTGYIQRLARLEQELQSSFDKTKARCLQELSAAHAEFVSRQIDGRAVSNILSWAIPLGICIAIATGTASSAGAAGGLVLGAVVGGLSWMGIFMRFHSSFQPGGGYSRPSKAVLRSVKPANDLYDLRFEMKPLDRDFFNKFRNQMPQQPVRSRRQH